MPPREKFGIQNLGIVIAFVVSLFVSAWEWLKDGKISIGEAFDAIPKLRKIPNVLACFKFLKREIEDLSTAEHEQLNLLVAEQLEIVSKTKAAKITSLILEALLYVRNLVEKIGVIMKTPDTEGEEGETEELQPEFFDKRIS